MASHRIETRSLGILIAVLVAKAFAIVFLILYSGIGLGPDEAQYWTWSRLPDWGYYSKPPGIAWEILFGTTLFGNTEIGVRSLAIAIGSALPLAVFLLAERARLSPSTCLWSGLCLAVSPLGVLASFLAITDGGMVLFWTIGCIALVTAIEQKKSPNYLLLGIVILLGALFKWPIYSLWIVILGSWILCPWMASWKSLRTLIAGFAISLLAFLPSLYWNASHEWATFRHVSATLSGGHAPPLTNRLIPGNPLDFIGAQAMLVSPILFILLVMGWGSLCLRGREIPKGVILCGLSSLIIIAGGVTAAFFMKMQGNWLIFAYPTAFVFLAWYAREGTKKKWLEAGAAFAIIIGGLVYAIPSVQANSIVASWQIPYKVNPFRHNVGWHNLDPMLTKAGYNPNEDFLFGDQYQMTSILSFYGPEQKRAYFLNLRGARKNQFSFWPGMAEEQVGKQGFFVAVENTNSVEALVDKYLSLLHPYFDEVQFMGIHPLFLAYGKPDKVALLYKCEKYNGKIPVESEIY